MPPNHTGAVAIDVSAALLFRDDRLLIAQRPAGGHLAGLWEFPGGKREIGETFEQCLRRELLEELGGDAHVGTLYQDVVHDYPAKSVHVRFFVCRWLGPEEPGPVGCAAVRWVTREELSRFEFPPADAALLDRLRSDTAVWTAR